MNLDAGKQTHDSVGDVSECSLNRNINEGNVPNFLPAQSDCVASTVGNFTVSTTPDVKNFAQQVDTKPCVVPAEQKTPFGLNKYALLFIYVFYTFSTARIYFGWPNLSNMLFRAGAYSWLCELNSSKLTNHRYQCTEQDSAVQFLFVLVCAVAFCCSFISGTFMDLKGPKLTAVIGQCLNFTAWCLLAFSDRNSKTYIPAMVFMGLGADAGFLPAANICNIFPKNEKLLIATISAAMGTSFAIPVILDTLWLSNPTLTLKELCLWYAGFGPGLAAILAGLFFPNRAYLSACELMICRASSMVEENRSIESQSDFSKSQNTLSSDKSNGTTVAVPKENKATLAEICCLNKSDDNASLGKKDIRLCNINEDESGPELQSLDQRNNIISNMNNKSMLFADGNNRTEPSANKIISLRQQLCSKHFWGIYIYWPLNVIFYNYYLTSAESIFGRQVNDALGIMAPLSFIPSIIIGKVSDIYGVMSQILFIISCGFFMYIFAIIHALWSYYISAVFSMLYLSCFSGQLYAYVNDTFESTNFGKIVGLVSAAGGLLSLLRGIIHQHLTMGTFQGNFTYTCIIMLSLVVVCFCIAILLLLVKRVQPKAYLKPIALPKETDNQLCHILFLRKGRR